MRTSLVLGVVALTLLAFILVFERGTVSTGEREQRKGRVLDTFVRDRVTRIELQRKGVTTVLTRAPDEENDLPLGAWQVDQPYAAKADHDTVDSLLGVLEWIDARRTLSQVNATDLSQFGLDKPRYRLAFVVGRQRVALSVGKDSPQGDGSYLRIGEQPTVYVVGKDVVEGLDHDAKEFHTKELQEGVSIFATQKLRVTSASDAFEIARRGDYFWIDKPIHALASEPALTTVVDAIDALKASHYITDDKSQVAGFGLSTPSLHVELDTHSYEAKLPGKDKFHDETLKLSVGNACADHNGESYLQVDDGSIVCALDADIAKLKKSALELRDMRLLVLDDQAINGAKLRAGNTELTLEHGDGDSWRYRQTQAGKEKASGAADAAAVSAWWKLLRDSQADELTSAHAPALDVGLATPSVVASFERKDKAPYEVRLGQHQTGRVAASRIDEGAVLWFPESVTDLLSTSTVRFRKLRVLTELPGSLTRLQITRPASGSEVVRKDAAGGYKHEAADAAAVDGAAVAELVRLLTGLDVLRFAADVARPEHGLSSPRFKVELELSTDAGGTRKHTLLVGSDTSDGAYARLDADPAVFVLPSALVQALSEPLVSRAALATPLEDLNGFVIEHDKTQLRVEHDDKGFLIAGTSDGERPRADALARTLATLRASGVLDLATGTKLADPKLTITIRDTHGASSLLSIVDQADANADALARRSGVAATFTLPRASVDALLGRVPSNQEPSTGAEP